MVRLIDRLKKYLLMYVGIFIYSLSPLMSKMASAHSASIKEFIFFYGASLFFLGIYALLWQQILQRFSLITAYSNRSLVTVFGMLWGILFFQETISWKMLLGAVLIIIGIQIVVKSDE